MNLRILSLVENKADKLFESNDCQTLLKMYKDFYPKIGFNLPWVAYLILQQNQVVGLGSFKGQPKEGKVEIAYWTFNGLEGQGIASFACKELITISQNASTKILENNGFIFTEIVQDEEIGDAWLWTLKMV